MEILSPIDSGRESDNFDSTRDFAAIAHDHQLQLLKRVYIPGLLAIPTQYGKTVQATAQSAAKTAKRKITDCKDNLDKAISGNHINEVIDFISKNADGYDSIGK